MIWSEDEVQRNRAVWESVRQKIECAQVETVIAYAGTDEGHEVAESIGRVAMLASVELVDPSFVMLRSIADAVEKLSDVLEVRREWSSVTYALRRGADVLLALKAPLGRAALSRYDI